jgi:PadR family transcriptional regulator PadR
MHQGAMLRKELVAASAEPLVLTLLSKGESYGYAIIQQIIERSDQQIEWTEGMLYPVLHRLERKGWVKARWGESETGRERKYYALTSAGKAALDEQQKEWDLVSGVLANLRRARHV